MFHLNVQCLGSKISDLEILFKENNIDCACINEHWLNKQQLNTYNIPGYSVISGFCRSNLIHGGVCILTKSSLECEEMDLHRLSAEQHAEVAGVFIKKLNLQILTIYRSPLGDFNMFLEVICKVLLKVNINKPLFITGDFNVHFNNNTDNRAIEVKNLFYSFGLHRCTHAATRNGACIDTIFTNLESDECHACVLDTQYISDHNALILDYNLGTPKSSLSRVSYRSVTDEGLLHFYNRVGSESWEFVSDRSLSINEKFEKFIEVFTNNIDICFPTKTKTISKCQSKVKINWFDDQLRDMRERLKLLVTLNKTNPRLMPKIRVTEYRKMYRKSLAMAKTKAHDNYIKNAINPQTAMWNIINQQKGHSRSPLSTSLDPDSFNDFFVSISDEIVHNITPSKKQFSQYFPNTARGTGFAFQPVSFNIVRECISHLKNSKSKDFLEIDTRLVKTVKNLIVYPLTKLINEAILTNTFPDILKTAKVIPIFKNKGSIENLSDYRPISILPIISKILESVLKTQINDYFERDGLYFQGQFGFRHKKSTTLAINSLTSHICEGFEKGLDTFASCLDLTKAFDCVSHNILLSKLKFYNFDSPSIDMLRSYLSNRTQFVSFNGISQRKNIRCGVPQGSVLGPTLFLIYINDLVNHNLKQNLILFADDTTIYESYHPSATEIANINICDTRESVAEWFSANGLSLNAAKTQDMNFSVRTNRTKDRLVANCQDEVRFLGVHLDGGLTWENHVIQLSSSLSRTVYLIRNLSGCVSLKVLMTAYHSLFNAKMSYAILAWGHSAHAKKVFGMQRRCIRVILNMGYRDDCRGAFRKLGILTLPCVFILQCLLYIKENQQSFVLHSEIHDYQTRTNNNIIPNYLRLARTRVGVEYHCVKFFNVLPVTVRNVNNKEFKTCLKRYLIEKEFFSFDEYLKNKFSDLQ